MRVGDSNVSSFTTISEGIIATGESPTSNHLVAAQTSILSNGTDTSKLPHQNPNDDQAEFL